MFHKPDPAQLEAQLNGRPTYRSSKNKNSDFKPKSKSKDDKSKKPPKLKSDFVLGNLATDLVSYTLDICKQVRDDNKQNPRFPVVFYDSYVAELIKSSLALHKHICYANSVRHDPNRRQVRQEAASAESVHLEHLILIAYQKGWISEKQHEHWQTMICNLHYGIIRWMSS